MALIPIYKSQDGTIIGAIKGKKSLYNFRVKYQQPGKAERTPKHIHIIIDLYMKLIGNELLTMQLVDHIIGDIILKVSPSTVFPPILQIFQTSHAQQFSNLNRYGEYPVDFLLVITELIQIQERTNYPEGTLNLNLFQLFRQKADIFSVVSAATFRGWR
jgi:hypothetical protein